MAKETKKIKKPKTSLRERNVKAGEVKEKPRRVRKAAAKAIKPVGIIAKSLKKEYHVLPIGEEPGFFTKSRRMTPAYFVDSIAEIKNVTWPKRRETWKLVFAVFVFAIITGLFITLLDYGLEKIFRNIIL